MNNLTPDSQLTHHNPLDAMNTEEKQEHNDTKPMQRNDTKHPGSSN